MENIFKFINLSLLVKLAFIFMFVPITIYCIYQENLINTSKGQKPKYLKSGPDGLKKSILEVLAVVGGLSSIYSLTDQLAKEKIKEKETMRRLAELQEQSRLAQIKLVETTTQSTQLKAKLISNCDTLKKSLDTLKDCHQKKSCK